MWCSACVRNAGALSCYVVQCMCAFFHLTHLLVHLDVQSPKNHRQVRVQYCAVSAIRVDSTVVCVAAYSRHLVERLLDGGSNIA